MQMDAVCYLLSKAANEYIWIYVFGFTFSLPPSSLGQGVRDRNYTCCLADLLVQQDLLLGAAEQYL